MNKFNWFRERQDRLADLPRQYAEMERHHREMKCPRVCRTCKYYVPIQQRCLNPSSEHHACHMPPGGKCLHYRETADAAAFLKERFAELIGESSK